MLMTWEAESHDNVQEVLASEGSSILKVLIFFYTLILKMFSYMSYSLVRYL